MEEEIPEAGIPLWVWIAGGVLILAAATLIIIKKRKKALHAKAAEATWDDWDAEGDDINAGGTQG